MSDCVNAIAEFPCDQLLVLNEPETESIPECSFLDTDTDTETETDTETDTETGTGDDAGPNDGSF